MIETIVDVGDDVEMCVHRLVRILPCINLASLTDL